MKHKKRLWLAGLSAAVLLGAAAALGGRYVYRYFRLEGQAPTSERLFETSTGGEPYYEPIQYRAKDSRPALTEPQFVEAARAKLVAGAMGIGVSVGGESRFYPLFILQYHQVVNDTCGGKAVACSY
jgi:hypothetical protein